MVNSEWCTIHYSLFTIHHSFLHSTLPILSRRHAHHAHELTLVGRGAQTVVGRDLLGHVELVQRVVHRLHAELLAGLHRRVDLVDLVVANQRANGASHDENLGGHHTTAADLRQQRLRDDALETECQLRAYLRLLVAREDVDD